MFVLFNSITGLDWSAFLESYRKFPFFSFDIIKYNNIVLVLVVLYLIFPWKMKFYKTF